MLYPEYFIQAPCPDVACTASNARISRSFSADDLMTQN